MAQAARSSGRSDLLQGRTIGRRWLRPSPRTAPPRPISSSARARGSRFRWTEAAQIVDELANGLLSLGVRKGDGFAILGADHTRVGDLDFALALIGAIGAPIYPSSSPRDSRYVVAHSEAIGVFCEDDEQRAKVAALALEHRLTFVDLDALRRARPRLRA